MISDTPWHGGVARGRATVSAISLFLAGNMGKYHTYSNDCLLEMMKQDDEIAFTTLYNRYWQKLYAIAYNRLKEACAAEDIVHDVFASLWANRHESQIISLENYLATAAKFLVFTKIKKLERERKYCSSLQAAPTLDLHNESRLHHKLLLELVEKEVENLPEKCRLIFKYSRHSHMPSKEIAEKLGISTKTVDNQLHKALKQLKVVARSFLFQVFFL